jgi:hypothetical protein
MDPSNTLLDNELGTTDKVGGDGGVIGDEGIG